MNLSLILGTWLVLQNPGSNASLQDSPSKTLQQAFDNLKREQEAERSAFRAADVDHEKDARRRQELLAEHRWQKTLFTERAMGLARSNANDPLSLDILMWLLDTYSDARGQVFDELVRHHISDSRIANACKYATDLSDASAEEFLDKARAENADRGVVGNATFWLAERHRQRAEVAHEAAESPKIAAMLARELGPREWERVRSRTEAQHRSRAIELYKETIDKYPDVTWMNRFGDGIALGPYARGKLLRLEDLVVGKPAPEIVGNDVDGQQSKLSDYRGRVVVLTFSGNWCGPCVAEYPHERAMVEKWRDRPFALLSVNTDQEKKSLRDAIKAGTITWRCWWDGGTDGPITTRWGVDTFPTVFVLDRQGIIRHVNVRGEELIAAVELLLKEGNE